MINGLVIRPLRTAAEARRCAEFMTASEPWLTLGFNADELFERLTDPTREVLVALLDQQIIGVLILHLAGPLNGYIQTLATRREWRGCGLGTRMMHFAEERIFRQSPNVFLCVSSFNHQAQKFYERLGYECVGELPDYLVTGHSELLLRKTRGPLLAFTPDK